MMGSGGMIVMDEDTCMVDVARYFLNFLEEESCGKCVPCREGVKRMQEIVTAICKGQGREGDIERLQELGTMIRRLPLRPGKIGGQPGPLHPPLFPPRVRGPHPGQGVPGRRLQAPVTYSVDADACTGCHVCFEKCPQEAVSGEKKKPHTIDQDTCIKCGICYDVCKFDAIKIC